MKSFAFLRSAPLLLSLSAALLAQSSPVSPILAQAAPIPVKVRRGTATVVPLTLQLKNGYHMNTNAPLDEFLIPLKLTWDAAPGVEVGASKYPAGKQEKYEFSEKPILVYAAGDVKVDTLVTATTAGPQKLTGKVRYQACTEKVCLPPRTITVSVPIEVE